MISSFIFEWNTFLENEALTLIFLAKTHLETRLWSVGLPESLLSPKRVGTAVIAEMHLVNSDSFPCKEEIILSPNSISIVEMYVYTNL